MAYTPTVWQTGDTITAEKLNKLENGVANIGGYDIVFTMIETGGFTADGASLEELASGGYKKALLSNPAGQLSESVGYVSAQVDSTIIGFSFVMGEYISTISFTGSGGFTFERNTNIVTGTYTYSNGHYVFTPSEGGGGVNPT